MYLIYIDESGKPSLNDRNELYVLTAVIIHESKWEEIYGYHNIELRFCRTEAGEVFGLKRFPKRR